VPASAAVPRERRVAWLDRLDRPLVVAANPHPPVLFRVQELKKFMEDSTPYGLVRSSRM
jgi:hypothetical protein